jgi:Tol biopolymer transport system component
LTPAWSPDGGRIAFTNVAPSGFSFDGSLNVSSEILLMNADGSNRRRLFVEGQLIDSRFYYFAPAWSPDVSRVAFTSVEVYTDLRLGGAGIYVVNADGTNRRRISTVSPTNPTSALDLFPSFSPDNTKITFSGARVHDDAVEEDDVSDDDRNFPAGVVGVFVVNADGGVE